MRACHTSTSLTQGWEGGEITERDLPVTPRHTLYVLYKIHNKIELLYFSSCTSYRLSLMSKTQEIHLELHKLLLRI
jgi:hypothetical protein